MPITRARTANRDAIAVARQTASAFKNALASVVRSVRPDPQANQARVPNAVRADLAADRRGSAFPTAGRSRRRRRRPLWK